MENKTEYSVEFVEKIGLAPSGKPWSYGIRTCANDGRSYNDFMWPLEIGARAECPDWSPVAECGNGLHANKFGLEGWDLLSMGDFENQILIVRWDSDLEVDLSGKHKFPWAEIVAVDKVVNWAKIYAQLAEYRNEYLREMGRLTLTTGVEAHSSTTGVEAHSSTTGDWAHSSTTGVGAHSSTTGARAHSSTTGVGAHSSTTGARAHSSTTGDWARSSTTGARAHSSTTGDWAHSSTTGARAHSSTTGDWAHSSTTGVGAHSSTTGARAHSSTTGVEAHSSTTGANSIAVAIGYEAQAKASAGGAIMLAKHEGSYPYQLTHVFAGMVGKKYGKTTIKPDVWYQLNDKGQPVEAVR